LNRSRSMRRALRPTLHGLEFAFKNLAVPIAFYIAFQSFGAKPAILVAISATLIVVLIHAALRIMFSPFFIVASGFTCLFGVMDLIVAQPRYFRLEPFAQNFLLGTVFLVSLVARTPIIAWFAGGLPKNLQPEPGEESAHYMRKLTVIWTAYFYAKAILFLELAFRVNLGELIVLRSIIGGGTLSLMVGGELIYRKGVLPRRRRRLDVQREAS